MDRLAEQVVAWHNSHPLAKRITIYDVHTIGVVALPFMRSGHASAGPIEPVLTDEISPESLAAAWSEESTIAAHPNAAYLDALADQEEPPAGRRRPWRERLATLLRRGSADIWPAFSERFVDGLSTARVAGFATTHGYATCPGDASWPQREVPIDDRRLADGAAAGGAWPVELYLKSAAIDAGNSRSRVLVGRGGAGKPPIIGRRCLSPTRLGLVGVIAVGLIGLATAAWWPSAGDTPAQSQPLAVAAPSPAPAPAPPSSPASSPAARAAAAALPASSAPEAAADAASTSASAAIPLPGTRPQLVAAAAPPSPRGLAASAPAEVAAPPAIAPATAPAPAAATAAASAPSPTIKATLREALQSGGRVVALVGPASASKADAEALLARMRAQAAPMQADPAALHAQVFQTPEGWRAAVWPFVSREEAQLINATLVARGLKTKALDF